MRLPFRKPLRALAAIGRWRPFAFVTHRNPVRNGMDSPPSVQTKRENQFFGSPARSFGCYRPVSNPGHLRLHPVSTSGCAGKHHSVNCSPSVSSGVGSAPSAGIILAVAVRLFQHPLGIRHRPQQTPALAQCHRRNAPAYCASSWAVRRPYASGASAPARW